VIGTVPRSVAADDQALHAPTLPGSVDLRG
jgi:hypothetical protein